MIAADAPRTTRWGSLPLSKWSTTSETDARTRLPTFERVSPESFGLGANPNLDIVVRSPGLGSPHPVPVGMVSKTYRIVQHHEILERVCGYAAKIPGATPGQIEVSMTANGERAMFRVDLGDAWSFGPDGNSVGLQIICRNSVDGSSAVRLHLGWFRFICSNGLVVGVTLGRARMAHTESSDMNSAFAVVESQLEIAKAERENLAKWAKTPVSLDAVRTWADDAVFNEWSTLSAARVWHICRSGRDASFSPPFEKSLPTRRKVKLLSPVPGAPDVAKTVYDVAQGLSWVASRRSDVGEADARQRDIGMLIKALKI